MYLAHINPNTKEEQSVKAHCKDVSEFCRSFGKKAGLSEMASLSGLLHDLGKGTKVFEEYIRFSSENISDKSQKGSIIHSAAGGRYILENFNSGDIFQRFTAQLLALAVCSHHTGLCDVIGTDGTDEFIKKLYPEKEIYYDEAMEYFDKECVEYQQIAKRFYKSRDEAIELINKMKRENIFDAFTLHFAVKYIFSCLIDGDRLDTVNFMENRKLTAENTDIMKLWEELSINFELKIEKLKCENEIDRLRKEISETAKAFGNNKPGIYRLYVPTGGGKTLSSFRYALSHVNIKEFDKERIFYIIPFTTIIEQNAEVIRDVIGIKKYKGDDIILEHHSNIVSDNSNEEYKLLTERWSSPIVLTTIVQFLNTLFSDGTQDIRRFHNLANSVIILDEIQCVPIKCVNLLNGALNFLSKLCNATIILCTATQPPLSETSKPLIINSEKDLIKNLEEKFLQFKRVNLVDARIDGGYNFNDISDFILDKTHTVSECLVILNTKATARNLYFHMKAINSLLPENEQFNLYHLSTSMCPAHRKNVLNEIRGKLGKERIICISTQMIEAGVDISFQCVIRALAGFDSIAQAAGRCNRHGKDSLREAYIINVSDEELSKLPEIKIGKECSERVLKEFKAYPDIYGRELLSPKVMDIYYSFYYSNLEEKMGFNVKNENTTIFELLDGNSKGINAYSDKEGKYPEYPLRQAFKTAGKNFAVIDINTTGVLVPFDNEGRELIEQLNGNCDSNKIKSLVKKAQQYTVNLFEYEKEKIGRGIFPLLNGGIIALSGEFYDLEMGVLTEGKPQAFLNI